MVDCIAIEYLESARIFLELCTIGVIRDHSSIFEKFDSIIPSPPSSCQSHKDMVSYGAPMAITQPTLLEMLRAGLHFGHRSSKWHPKMAPFIFGARGGIHIINLEKTSEQLARALDFAGETSRTGGTRLCVGTKPQAKEVIKTEATTSGMPYVTERWLGGTLTNFKVINELVRRFLDLKRQRDAGELGKYTKFEQGKIHKQIAEMEVKVGGIQTMMRLPSAVFILDLKHEKTAFAEARHCKIPVIAICDSNVNPEGVDYPIPGNDDAVSAITMVVKLLGEAVREGKDAVVQAESAV